MVGPVRVEDQKEEGLMSYPLGDCIGKTPHIMDSAFWLTGELDDDEMSLAGDIARVIHRRMPVMMRLEVECLEAAHDVIGLLTWGPVFDRMVERAAAYVDAHNDADELYGLVGLLHAAIGKERDEPAPSA